MDERAALEASHVNEVGTQLNEAAARHLTTWLLTRDWGAVAEWCLLHAAALQQL